MARTTDSLIGRLTPGRRRDHARPATATARVSHAGRRSTELPTLADALALGLTESEYELVCEKQGGPPNRVELAMYSLLWSEHCAYKHSRKLLRTLVADDGWVSIEVQHLLTGDGASNRREVLPVFGD